MIPPCELVTLVDQALDACGRRGMLMSVADWLKAGALFWGLWRRPCGGAVERRCRCRGGGAVERRCHCSRGGGVVARRCHCGGAGTCSVGDEVEDGDVALTHPIHKTKKSISGRLRVADLLIRYLIGHSLQILIFSINININININIKS